MYLRDPKTGKESVTLTMFVIGFLVVTGKLLIAGVTFDGIKFDAFSGTDYGVAIAALGSVYVLRKNNTIKDDKPNE